MKSTIYRFWLALAAFGLYACATAVAGTIDPGFNPADYLTIKEPAKAAKHSPTIQEVPKPYIIFNNLETGQDWENKVISNMYSDIYVKCYDVDPTLPGKILEAPFSDETFNQYKITDFDVAIFPMGNFPLQANTTGGIRIIDKIQEMLQAGKRVMVIGRAMLTWAYYDDPKFAAGKDPAVLDFLNNTLGIDAANAGPLPIAQVSGSTISFLPFKVVSPDAEIVTRGYDKYCNQKYGRNHVEPAAPYSYRALLDVFKLKKDSKSIAIDIVDTLTSGVNVGLRAQVGDGKICFWSTGFDVAAATELEYWRTTQLYAMQWFINDLPRPEAYLDLESNKLKFGAVPVGESKTLPIRIRNYGKTTLKISKVELAGFSEDPTAFEIVEGNTPVDLAFNEIATVKVKFTPKVESDYSEILDISSNASNGTNKSIDLEGKGGTEQSQGSEITVESGVDFGKTKKGVPVTKNIQLKSTGTGALRIDKIEIIENNQHAFEITELIQMPQNVESGNYLAVPVKMSAFNEGDNYTAQLKVTSNDPTRSPSIINLTGSCEKTVVDGAVIALSIDPVDFKKVKLQENNTLAVYVRNDGSKNLLIKNMSMSENPDDAFELVKTIPSMTTVLPGDSTSFEVKFSPTQEKLYTGKIVIMTNAVNNDQLYVNLSGEGTTLSVRDESTSSDGLLSVKLVPNPASSSSVLELGLNGNNPCEATAYVVDLLGNRVMNINPGFLAPGKTVLPFAASGLATGQYFIVVSSGTSVARLPIIIAK